MPFLNPFMLFGLAAAGVPVLIHLLNRRRAKTIDWGAMMILRRVVRFRSRRIRLEDIFLMVMRCLAIGLVVLAAARPTTKWLGGGGSPDLGMVIAIDNSLSMGHGPPGRTRLGAAQIAASEILETLPDGRPVTVVALGARPEVVVRGSLNREETKRAIQGLRPGHEALTVEQNLDRLQPLLAEIRAPHRELYLVTDAQFAQWQQPSPRAKDLFRRLAQTGSVFLVPVTPAGEENMAITDFRLVSGALCPGTIAKLTARVRNFGRRSRDMEEIRLFEDETVVGQRLVGRLGPGEEASVSFYYTVRDAGQHRVTARLVPDELEADDSRRLVVVADQSVRVLLVDGKPSSRPFEGASDYVAAALAPETDRASDMDVLVTKIPWPAFPATNLSLFDVVVLADVPEVPEGKSAELYEFVQRGGGLIVFVGPGMSHTALNGGFVRGEVPLLPAKLQEVVDLRVGTEGLPLATELPNHPLTGPLQALDADQLGDSTFDRIVSADPHPGARTVLRLAAGGQPVLLEHDVGQGKVLLFTSSADRSWNDFCLSPAYWLMVRQALTYLTRRPNEAPFVVGYPVVYPFPASSVGHEAMLRRPDGGVERLEVAVDRGAAKLVVPPVQQKGFYELKVDGSTSWLAANVDPAESDVRVAAPDALREAVDNEDIEVLPDTADVIATARRKRVGRELWYYLALAAVVLMTVEALVARRISRRQGVAANG